MPRRYQRTSIELFERRDVPFREFPEGAGPPILMSAKHGEWRRLGFGEAQAVEFGDEPGGAFAFGLIGSVVVIWMYLPEGGPGRAYCYHAPAWPLSPQVHAAALRSLECAGQYQHHLYVVLASGREITRREEAAVLQLGIHDDKLFTYSNALLAQFGVSNRGLVGEAS
jgi:hypothetical protein